ncbi:hypothetical protein L6452_29125 [Arctium lappa]|uniref:Uncharacterized protein n=1 Tax=Arctium lappa TaxID=4217 RepID=A0ACB8ZG84_ARCLA|nr:hypothetical protein L6452_29125 [Arctium lappa]
MLRWKAKVLGKAWGQLFPRAFELDRNPRATVADRMGVDGHTWEWRRELRGGRESSEVEQMQEIMNTVTITESEDKWSHVALFLQAWAIVSAIP